MKKILFLLSFFFVFCVKIFPQTTIINGSFSTGNEEECGRLKSVEIRPDGVVVSIEVKALKKLKRLRIFSSNNTFIKFGSTKILQLSGLVNNDKLVNCGVGSNWGFDNVPKGETRTYKLFFKGSFPDGITTFSMVDDGDYRGTHGYCFRNYTITNPRKNYVNIISENAAKQNIDANDDGLCGIYEPFADTGANLACVKINGEHKLIYLSSPTSYSYKDLWEIGDIKANLRQTASGIMKADWFSSIKTQSSAYVSFDGISMKSIVEGTELIYLKTYPIGSTSNSGSSNSGKSWTGTGFALKEGYIVTNNHVVENSSTIMVLGVNGNPTTEYNAIVIATDKKNDLAIIRINDSRFAGFNDISYAIKNRQCEVGEDVFVLGYPLTTYMGNEIKLTNGIVSSKSGYQGDVTTYQISAPVQPGNSGGPLFDKYGNVVGIVNAGIPGAENVGYAIKTSYLFNLISTVSSTNIIPQENTITGESLSDIVKSVKNSVYYIKCR